LPNEEHVVVAVRELLEETGVTLTPDDFTMLTNKPVRMPLTEGKHQLVYVFSASFPVRPYVTANLRTLAKVLKVVTAKSTINLDGTYVVLESIDIDRLSLTATKIGLLPAIQRKFELLHFGYVAQWETFRRAVTTNQLLSYDDMSLARQFLFYFGFSTVDTGRVRMLIKGYIYQPCREKPTDLRMGDLAPITICCWIGRNS
jgi:ADP-ribose pyrophosphatase YjhB (NUDIX family)